VLHSVVLAPASRVVAVLLALSLSGGVGVAGELAPKSPHHCVCLARKGAEHRCTCPICARIAAGAADERTVEGAPPCHRGVTRHEPAEAPGDEREFRSRDLPGLREDCGREEDAALGLRAVDAFTLRAAPGLVPPAPASWPAMPSRRLPGTRPEPETPPPRR
jgi:hypothetical protein